MKFIVHEPTTQTQKVFSISGLETVDSFSKIPKAVGELKGDLIVFRGDSDPSRLPLGTNGQMLVVDTSQEVGVKWESNANSVATTKGDIVAYKSGGTPARLPVGVNGQALVADSAQNEGIKWGYPTQLDSDHTIQTKLSSTSAVAFNGSANIQPGVTGVLPVANGGTGNQSGNAPTASKLNAEHVFVTYLAKNYNYAGDDIQRGRYDLSEHYIGVPISGILQIDHGGTGANSWAGVQETLGFLGGTCQGSSATDLDTALKTLLKAKTSSTVNSGLYTALGSNFVFVIQLFYSDGPGARTTTSTRLQIAFSNGTSNTNMAWRVYNDGWSNWHKLTAS